MTTSHENAPVIFSKRFLVHFLPQNYLDFHPGFLYGENAVQLKNKAVLEFGRSGRDDNCKNAIETGLWDRYMRMIESKEPWQRVLLDDSSGFIIIVQ